MTVCSEKCCVTADGWGEKGESRRGRGGGRRREGVGVPQKVRLKHTQKTGARARPANSSTRPSPSPVAACHSPSLCCFSFSLPVLSRSPSLCCYSLTLLLAAGWRRGRNGTSPTSASLIETPTETRAVENACRLQGSTVLDVLLILAKRETCRVRRRLQG